MPTVEEIAALRDARSTHRDGVRKLITQAFVRELRVMARDRIEPLFRVLRGLPYMPDGAERASDVHARRGRTVRPTPQGQVFAQ